MTEGATPGVPDLGTSALRPDLFAGRVYLVTGGGTGLGLSLARRLGSLGARLVIASRAEDHLAEATRVLEAQGTRVAVRSADLRKVEDVSALMDFAFEAFGRLDGVVNNAAGNFLARTEDLSPRGWETVVDTVLHGTFRVTQEAGKRWIQRKERGSVLNIVTTYAWTGAAFVVPSAAAKAGVLAMTRSLAVEWAHYGLRLNALAPGPVPTKGAWDRLVPGADVEGQMRDHVPAGRMGTHGEFADVAAFLLSDAAGYITGECVVMDGGEWLVGHSFQLLRQLPPEFWDAMGEARRKAKGTSPGR